MNTDPAPLHLTVNGRAVHTQAPPAMLLVDLLRGALALTGTHIGCDTAQCGACTVLLDGQAVRACSVLAVQAAGREVTTVEGLAGADGTLHPLQEAFTRCHALQCGFCTPGVLMSSLALLRECPQPGEHDVLQALEGHLCRCTGYANIVTAVLEAARDGAAAVPPAGARA
jgi:carbon-monoxide dehydrogenase small subunit